MGMWVPVHGDEWDGETPLEVGTAVMDSQSGEVVFRGSALPWKAGTYEVHTVVLHEIAWPDPTGNRSAITTMGNTTLWRSRSR